MKLLVLKWGDNLAVRIPKPVAAEACIKEGDLLEIEAEAGHIELRKAGKVPSLAELVAAITPENRYQEVSTGAVTGKESIGESS